MAAGEVSSVELVSACLARIRERDGEHGFDGSASSVNAWARVYEVDAPAGTGLRAVDRLAEPERSLQEQLG